MNESNLGELYLHDKGQVFCLKTYCSLPTGGK